MYNLELHITFATITLFFLLMATATGVMLFFKKPKGWYRPLRVAHAITGLLTLLFFLLTWFFAP